MTTVLTVLSQETRAIDRDISSPDTPQSHGAIPRDQVQTALLLQRVPLL